MEKEYSGGVIQDCENSLYAVENLKDLEVDLVEISIDGMIENEILKEIPIVKSVVALLKTGFAIKERHFVRNFIIFLNGLASKRVDEKVLNDFREKIRRDTKYKETVLGHLVIIIDRIIENKKAEVLACLFINYLYGKYDWDRFIDLTICLDSLPTRAYTVLLNMAVQPGFTCNVSNPGSHELEGLLYSGGIAIRNGEVLSITKLGQDFYNYGVIYYLYKDKKY